MKQNVLSQTVWLYVLFASLSPAAEFRFQHHFINRELPISERGNGDYGLTALVDLDRDGDLDFVLGGRGVQPPRLYWFEFRSATNWVQHIVGTNYQSDVGVSALDVDGDGWTDLVCSGVWYRNTGKPASEPFQRMVFATNAAGAHDIVATDIDGDGRRDIVLMGDERTPLKALCWFKISPDPKKLWERHHIGPAVHGAITPNGIADLDGDGDPDLLRADAWFENQDKGRNWIARTNIPFGRVGPFGKCVRTAVADLDGDGDIDICSKPWGVRSWNGTGGKMHVDFLENLLKSPVRKP